MLRALITDIVQHQSAEPSGQESLKRICAYVEAAAACLLIVAALFAVYPG